MTIISMLRSETVFLLLHRQTLLETLSHELLLAETFDLELLRIELDVDICGGKIEVFLVVSVFGRVGSAANHTCFFICELRGKFCPPFNFLVVFRE
ncbi:hypothetical protein EUGRSUZ_B01068 [Eucalyptus grandis]|uniref:Uncharacterized protein n=2 Tax=Eucalyptus grandis TaxID=71139 RepID=A0ACC3LR36_EUCGR|nr:hypothetical protein EUGRSUZ_B01068 [Eucalyptus grandis]